MARTVSNVGSLQSIWTTQSQEFATLQQHTTHLIEEYEQFYADYELCRMAMDIRSQMGGTCSPPFLPYGPGNDQPPPTPPIFLV